MFFFNYGFNSLSLTGRQLFSWLDLMIFFSQKAHSVTSLSGIILRVFYTLAGRVFTYSNNVRVARVLLLKRNCITREDLYYKM